MGRLLAIDYGSKRTGIAITDELKLIASGLTTVNTKELLKFLNKYFTSENVDVVLIGEPRQRDGTQSLIEVEIKKFVIILSEAFPKLKIVRVDERFTSKIALQTMIDSGLKKKQRQNKELIDEISATIILQDYLYKKK